jgi:hypothetical protein
MAAVTVTVANLPKVQARLTELGQVKIPKVMAKVVKAGALPMRAAIKAAGASMFENSRGPSGGGLEQGIRFKKARDKKAAVPTYMVGPFGKGTRHRHLVINGHAIHGHISGRIGGDAAARVGGGKRTHPVPFVEAGRKASASGSVAAIETAARAALAAAEKL